MAEHLERRSPGYGWLAGPAAVGLGAAAHLVSGGQNPGPLILLAMTALISLAATLPARLLTSGWSLVVFCGLIQQLLHLAFTFFAAPAGGGSPEHGHGAVDWQISEVPAAAASSHSGELMVDTHVAAALLTALLLSRLQARHRRHIMEGSRSLKKPNEPVGAD